MERCKSCNGFGTVPRGGPMCVVCRGVCMIPDASDAYEVSPYAQQAALEQMNAKAATTDALHEGNWILTFTGKRFHPMAPKVEDLCIEDIAHALSNNCRFTGHVRSYYSVAQHCVLASHLVPEEHALAALLHDASEAYLSDLARPVKRHRDMQSYRDAEQVLESCIMSRFNVDIYHEEVKKVDNKLLCTERRDLMPVAASWPTDEKDCYPTKILPCSPREAELRFLARYEMLT